jgi:hypothetical protein
MLCSEAYESEESPLKGWHWLHGVAIGSRRYVSQELQQHAVVQRDEVSHGP